MINSLKISEINSLNSPTTSLIIVSKYNSNSKISVWIMIMEPNTFSILLLYMIQPQINKDLSHNISEIYTTYLNHIFKTIMMNSNKYIQSQSLNQKTLIHINKNNRLLLIKIIQVQLLIIKIIQLKPFHHQLIMSQFNKNRIRKNKGISKDILMILMLVLMSKLWLIFGVY